jgi:cystathionine gamma-synthase
MAHSSGLAAIDSIIRLLAPGDRVTLGLDAYGGTWRLLDRVWKRFGIHVDVLDVTDVGTLRRSWVTGTRLVLVETPSNPRLQIADIARLAEVSHEHGALLAVDSTFATPALQQPLALGANLVTHSTTKYLGGHSDVVGGVVLTDDAELAEELRFHQKAIGAVPGPFDSFLVLRGLRTLSVRMQRHCENAQRVAEFLQRHPGVGQVYYPGLVEHPGHAVAARQMRGFGGMVSFTLNGGEDAARTMVTRTELFTLAESLGAVESLIEHPASMTHASSSGSLLAVDPALVRLSVGIEDAGDLINDLDCGLHGL